MKGLQNIKHTSIASSLKVISNCAGWLDLLTAFMAQQVANWPKVHPSNISVFVVYMIYMFTLWPSPFTITITMRYLYSAPYRIGQRR